MEAATSESAQEQKPPEEEAEEGEGDDVSYHPSGDDDEGDESMWVDWAELWRVARIVAAIMCYIIAATIRATWMIYMYIIYIYFQYLCSFYIYFR